MTSMMSLLGLFASHRPALRLALAGLALGLCVVPTAGIAQSSIYACVTKGTGQIRIVPAESACERSEYPLTWGTSGPPGPPGPPGATGPAGPSAPAGPASKVSPSDCPACVRKQGRD
jgi:hypothetical protein